MDEPDADGPPTAVRAAGWLWALQGGTVAAVGAGLVLLFALSGEWWAWLCPAPIVGLGGALAWAGVAVTRGRVSGVRSGGSVSLAVGAFAGLNLAFAAANGNADAWFVAGVGGLAVGVALPGVLALAGADHYLSWRAGRAADDPPDR